MNRFACIGIALLAYTLALPPAAAVANSSCGRLSTGDTFNDLNKILDCIEAKAAGQPVTATPDESAYVEEREPNNRIGEANPIALGTTVRGSIKKGNEYDTYRFAAPPDDGVVRIILRQTQTNGFVPRINVYNDLEIEVAKITGDENKTISLPLETEANRSYYVSITCTSHKFVATCKKKNNDYELVVKPE
jgi:hypothetical protein